MRDVLIPILATALICVGFFLLCVVLLGLLCVALSLPPIGAFHSLRMTGDVGRWGYDQWRNGTGWWPLLDWVVPNGRTHRRGFIEAQAIQEDHDRWAAANPETAARLADYVKDI